ncbi:hypothetical protein MNBD_BACTEROID03-771 [hydrothermal vent metagenome]|uniref:Lipoyl-binding domain-containing protein n=1 Tax=hydrothermal vent metagenome TaxID=652676 RepID=A0A3B0TP50_9ZZZZ
MAKYTINVANEEFYVDTQEIQELNIVQVNENTFHLLDNRQAYQIECSLVKNSFKEMIVSVNGNDYKVKIKDTYDERVKNMGLLSTTSQKVSDIKAPMPGLVIDVLVENGEEISEGTPLVVLSAMKMENIILAPNEGIIKSIEVEKDQAVEKGQLLITLE